MEQNQDKSLEEIEEEEKSEASNVPQITDDAARSLVCDDCGKRFRGTAEVEFHASKTQHENFSQSVEEIAPLTEEEKKAKLEALREKLAAKRAVQSEQDKADQKRNEVSLVPEETGLVLRSLGNPAKEYEGVTGSEGRSCQKRTDEGCGEEEGREAGGYRG